MLLPPLLEPAPALSAAERTRTARHRRLPELGEMGQRRLAAARVLVIGAGGLGAPILQYLAAAGIATIGIVDDDVVDASNLQRQVIHSTDTIGQPKVFSAAARMRELAPEITVEPHRVRLSHGNAGALLADYHLVLDGTDNFTTRYLVADTCADLGIPLVWGSVLRFDAQVSVFWSSPPAPARPVTLRDLFPAPPAPGEVPSCADAGVLGALCGMVGSMMAMEAIKLVTGIGEVLLGRVAVVDALSMRVVDVPFARPTHSAHDGAAHLPRRQSPHAQVGGPARHPAPSAITAADLGPRVALLDVREPDEFATDPLPGALNVPIAALEAAAREGSDAVDHLLREVGLDEAEQLATYCAAGARAKRAARALTAAGRNAGYLPPEAVQEIRGQK